MGYDQGATALLSSATINNHSFYRQYSVIRGFHLLSFLKSSIKNLSLLNLI